MINAYAFIITLVAAFELLLIVVLVGYLREANKTVKQWGEKFGGMDLEISRIKAENKAYADEIESKIQVVMAENERLVARMKEAKDCLS